MRSLKCYLKFLQFYTKEFRYDLNVSIMQNKKILSIMTIDFILITAILKKKESKKEKIYII